MSANAVNINYGMKAAQVFGFVVAVLSSAWASVTFFRGVLRQCTLTDGCSGFCISPQASSLAHSLSLHV
jgi:hypothetical protein